ncbi:prevent-host-death family protein [Quadrisphaera granulorum]|uniref:Prevent-host-death family protein n=1 Tax=Quadrisphaera granulorum TaxID=317664 RepID=A0A316AAJ0_9ACTN|nr:type II toxin-antitoxin system prevent-host-death family antitoxin [Quadrisphaera granulorum]PWJ54208.1 prevent-host-death family protein [Quadrisphaera granulorum]SZE96347.1 prevent-host-death family protein [Quadrisphaera granulorum]
MENIAHRDLRNNSSEVLRRVAAGESFQVTNFGAVVARLVPAGRPESAPGLTVRRAISREPFSPPPASTRPAPEGDDARGVLEDLDELRADR